MDAATPPAAPAPPDAFARRARLAIGLGMLAVVAALAAWRVAEVLLVVFAGVLLAIFLRGLADGLASSTRLPPRGALAVVILVLLGVTGVGGWLLSGNIAAQVDQLARDLPRAVRELGDRFEDHEWGRLLLSLTPGDLVSERALENIPGLLSRTLGTTFGLVVNVVIIAFVGLYLALEAEVYARGILRLVPPARRHRAAEVLAALRYTLQWWLIGKVVVMALVGTLTVAGLWLLEVPLALTLGLLAGLLDFVPYVGPLLGFLPAILLALTQSLTLALWVTALYVVVQSLESYVFTPLAQWRAVSLAPALTVVCQVILTVLFGPLGLLLATPLTAAGLVLVKMLYVEDVLGDRMDIPGARAHDVVG